MPLRNPITEPQIPRSIARTIETLSIAPRTGGQTGVTIDANTIIPSGTPVTIRWIDGNHNYVNFPFPTFSGTMIQVDALYNTVLVGKYMIQCLLRPDLSKIYLRTQNNGNWGSWTAIE
ncbi:MULTISPECIES: hypothetical protein [unclassified Microcoleus]|uniref:hypothetical protein n=1 Tax=unclassified Microcoleus TaxID=2642155 RepID=UPI002FD4F38E